MSNKYWIGGSGNWSDTTHWSATSGGTFKIDSIEDGGDSATGLYNGSRTALGQSFTGTGIGISSVSFNFQVTGLPTGNIVAKIYAHSGVYGTSSIPTGSPLAVSDNLDSSTIGNDWFNLTFSGVNQIILTNGVLYVLVVEFSGGSLGNEVQVVYDGSSPTHGGNMSYYDGSWTADASSDMLFILYNTNVTSIPTSTDDVFIDSNSGFGSGGTISLDGDYYSAKCHDFSSQSGHSYSIEFVTSDFSVYGSYIGESGLTWNSGTWLYLHSDTPGETITLNGGSLEQLNIGYTDFVNPNGTWTITDNLSVNDQLEIYTGNSVFQGTVSTINDIRMYGSGVSTINGNTTIGDDLILNDNSLLTLNSVTAIGFNVDLYNSSSLTINDTLTTVNTFSVYDSSNVDVNSDLTSISYYIEGTAYMGSGTWLANASGDFFTASSATIYSETSTIKISNSETSELNRFIGGNNTFYNLTISPSVESETQIEGSNTFNTITIEGPPQSVYFENGSTTTVNEFNAAGKNGNMILLNDSTYSGNFTISKSSGVVSCGFLNINNSTATGGATWYAGRNSSDSGQNSGWIFTNPGVWDKDSTTPSSWTKETKTTNGWSKVTENNQTAW